MVRVAPLAGGSDGRGDASAVLFFDPNVFPASVAGVTRACDGMETIAEQVPPTLVDPSAFGAASPVVLAFHRAWSAEVATARSALKEMVDILPVTGKAYLHADHESSP
jgi:hypothetical protein